MIKLSLFLLLCINCTTFAQVNFSSTLPFRTTPENSWDGIDVEINLGLAGSTSAGGVSFRATAYDKKVNSIKIRQREIPASQIPSHVLGKLKNDLRVSPVTFDLYVNSRFVKTMTDKENIGWAELQGLDTAEGYKQAVRDAGYKLFNSGALSVKNVSINIGSYRLDPDYYNSIVKEITSGNTASKDQSGAANNSVTEVGLSMTSSSSTGSATDSPAVTATTGGIPANTSGNDPLANYTPSSAYSGATTKEEVYIQAAATVVGSLIDEMNANYDEKMARWQAESDANTAALRAANKKKTEVKFRAEFLPLMPLALKGDDDARMALYYAGRELDCYDYVPYAQGQEWIKQAAANNNINGILQNSLSLGYMGPECIAELEKAATLGSLDAMVILGSWFNQKPHKTWGVEIVGGDNPQKAIEWFTQGAIAGCPACMYRLGQIYKYGKTDTVRGGNHKKGYVKYDKSILNEKLAFEWFSKSVQYPAHKKSVFARSLQTNYWFLSEFELNVYHELATMYTEGKVVPKDEAKAKELTSQAAKWVQLTENEDIRDMSRY